MKRTGNSKIAVIGWGRGMGHKGHMYLADAVITQAINMKADPYFFVSKTVGKDDPIFPEEKVKIYQKVFPQYANIFEPQGNLNQALQDLASMGYQGVVVVVGADQKQAFQYLEKPNKEGVPVYQSMGLKKLRVISRQETNSKFANEEGPRATPMREILLDPNATEEDKFKVWRRDMPEELGDRDVLDIMNKAESRLVHHNAPKVLKTMDKKPSTAKTVKSMSQKAAELKESILSFKVKKPAQQVQPSQESKPIGYEHLFKPKEEPTTPSKHYHGWQEYEKEQNPDEVKESNNEELEKYDIANSLYAIKPEIFTRFGDEYIISLIEKCINDNPTGHRLEIMTAVFKHLTNAVKTGEMNESRIIDRNAKINAYYISSQGKKHKVAEGIPYYLLDKLVSGLTKKYNITMNDIEVRPADAAQYRRTNQPELVEFAPSDNGGGRKFLPWDEFIGDLKAILGDHFDVVENVVKDTIKARFVPHDPMEFGPTMLYSYFERRAGRNKGAVSTRGAIQVGKYVPNDTALGTRNFITQFSLLKGHPFQRHFDLTGENVQKIADIIIGNTQGAYQMQPQQGVSEGSKYKCTCHPGDSDPDCPVHGLEPMEVGDALDVKEGEEEALAYATKAHAGQTRSGGDPYITHPVRVANHIKQFKQSHNLDALISAAYLHDTIEDTDTTQEILHDLFGGLVASLVKELTSDPEEIKKVGKAQYLSHKMAAMSSYGLVIKLADRLDNVKDITTARTPQWRAKYAAETNQILNYIEKTRALSGTHNKLIELIRAKLAEIDNPQQGVAEGSGPQVGDAVYYGKRLVGWFKGYSKHGKIITEPNYEELGDEYANRDVYWDPQDKITIKPEQGVAEAGMTRRGILKGIAGAGALGAAGKASAIAGAFPTPSAQQAMYKAAADSNRAEAKRQAELKAKADAERLEKNTQEVDREQRVNHHKLDEFAPGNGDDGIPHAEYQVYQCNPEDQFDWIGGPLYQTDSMGMAHKYAYEMYVKHRPKAFMVWQEHTQGSRGNYGVKGESDHNEDDLKEDYLDEK